MVRSPDILKNNITTFTVIIYVLIVLLFLFQTVFYSPIIFGDEGFYASNTRWIAENHMLSEYEPNRGTKIMHEKIVVPPLYYITQVIPWMIAGEIGLKFMIPIFSILTSLILFIFLKKLGKPIEGLIAAAVFLAIPSLITYSVLNYTDGLLCLFFAAAAYFGYFAFQNNEKKYAILSGVFTGLGFLTKGSGFLIIALFLVYLFLSKKFRDKKMLKTFGIILLVSSVIIIPWFIRSMVLYDAMCYHPVLMSNCDPKLDVDIEKIEGLEFEGRIREAGMEANIWKLGLLNYASFAYGTIMFILLIFAFANAYLKKQNIDKYLISWVILIIPILLISTVELLGSTGRAEDTARYSLQLVIPFAMMTGFFVKNVYEKIKSKSKIFAIIFIAIFLLWTMSMTIGRSSEMYAVKQFSPGFFEACEWVKENTPDDSVLFTIYAHHAMYHCERMSRSGLPDKEEILLTDNYTSYEHLKLHGINYVFIPVFSVSEEKYKENFPIDFVRYLDASAEFEKVLDNTQTYGANGVIIYKVL